MILDADNDRRHVSRARALLAGRIAYGDPQVSVACTIRSLTADGAMVELETPTLFNGPIQLLVIARGEAYDAAIVWNRGLRLGLSLTARHDLRESPSPARYLQAIWRQTAAR
ncbi:MAG: type pilus assembly PilZ [Caulobacteraceae bacterium]|nr:type pilus assembly PilZ [Caulobacteraceae bacterium]